MTTWQLLLVALLAVTASGAIASGGFTAADADRTATVAVVEDTDAYLGIQTHDIERNRAHTPDTVHLDADLASSETDAEADLWLVYRDVPIVTLTNRHTHAYDVLDLGPTPGNEPPAIEPRSTPDGLPTGESGHVTVDVRCPVVVRSARRGPNGDLDVVVAGTHETDVTTDAVAESTEAGIRVDVERTSTVRCDFPGVTLDGDYLSEHLDDSELRTLLGEESEGESESESRPESVSQPESESEFDRENLGVLQSGRDHEETPAVNASEDDPR